MAREDLPWKRLRSWLYARRATRSLQRFGVPKVLGKYRPGQAPLYIDPRLMRSIKPEIVFAHEQFHRDLVQCTYYGYCLARLLDLSAALPAQAGAGFRENGATFFSGMFMCAEGYACVAPIPMMGRLERITYLAALPRAYRTAIGMFKPLLPSCWRRLDIRQGMFFCFVVAAVSELALDLPVYGSRERLSSFHDLLSLLLDAEPPDARLPRLVDQATRLSIEDIPATVLDAAILPTGLSGNPAHREGIMALKKRLFEKLGGATSVADSSHFGCVTRLDSELIKEHPGLRRIKFLPHVLGADFDLRLALTSPWIVPEKRVATEVLENSLQLATREENHGRLLVRVVMDAETQCHLTGIGLQMQGGIIGLFSGRGFTYCAASTKYMVELDRKFAHLGLIWLSLLSLKYDQSSVGPLFVDVFSRLRSPVYLFAHRFNEHLILEMKGALGRLLAVYQSGLTYPEGCSAIVVKFPSVSIFAVLPSARSIEGTYFAGGLVEALPASDSLDLSAAILGMTAIGF